jgi:O-antigen/teichoic acid export membrane protein
MYVAFAGLLANALGSPDLADLFRISAGVIAAYSCYAVFIGSFNGKLQFNRQAAFDITYATIKTGLIVGLAAAGLEVLGTVMGFLGASVIIAIAAFFVAGLGVKGSFPARRYLPFAATLFLYTFVLNLVMSLDLFLLKGISAKIALSSGMMSLSDASLASKALAGQYGAAQGLAFIPYQAILSIAFVAFPMISKVTFADDATKTREYIRKTLRMSTILIVGIACVFAALPSQSLGLIFPPEYKVASEGLGILSLGIAAFGIMVVSNTILNASGLVWRSMLVVGLTLCAVIAAVVVSIYRAGYGPEALAATATGTAVGMGIGVIISGIVVYKRFGTFWPWGSAIRVAIAGAATIAVGRFFMPDAGKLITLVECIGIFVLYFVLLGIIREFKKEDLAQLKQVISRGKKSK